MPPSTVYCDNCGAANRPQARFCTACGELMAAVSSPGSPGVASSTGLLPSQSLLKQRYRILSQAGKGGFGAVYKAADTQLGNRLVAVKELSQKGLDQQELAEAAEAFRREAHLLAGLFHRHLPRIYDHFDDGGRWYLVMDYIEGETLEDYLDQAGGKLPVEEVVDIGIQLCTVLGYLHQQQPPIIFRDLKPANVMRTPDGELFLIDFGIARLFKPGKAKDTTAYGSAGYAAPEQYGKGQTTPQSDMYSLGATLHQLLTGDDPAQTPFRFASLSLSGAALPVELGTLIAQMVEMDDDKRPASALLVKQRLQDITVALPKVSSPVSLPVPPKKPTPADQKTLQRLRDEGKEHFKANRFDMALPIYERINNLDPTDASSHFYRGVALMALSRGEEALSAYEQAVRFDPGNARYHTSRGNMLAGLGRYSEALAAYEHIAPTDASSHFSKGSTLEVLGRHKEALSAYEQAVHLNPEDALFHASRGNMLATLGRYSEALAAYEQALRFAPEIGTYRNSKAWEGKSKVLQQFGKSQEAQEARQKAERSRALWMKASEKR